MTVRHISGRSKLVAVATLREQTPFHAAFAYFTTPQNGQLHGRLHVGYNDTIEVWDDGEKQHLATYSRGALERAEKEGKAGPIPD